MSASNTVVHLETHLPHSAPMDQCMWSRASGDRTDAVYWVVTIRPSGFVDELLCFPSEAKNFDVTPFARVTNL